MSCKYSVGLKQALNFSKQQCVPLFFLCISFSATDEGTNIQGKGGEEPNT